MPIQHASIASTRPSARSKTGSRAKNIDSEREGYLTPYFREMATHEVMSRDEEYEAALRIATLRRSYWTSLLAYPSFVEGILGLVEESLGAGKKRDALPLAEMKMMALASRCLRDRDLVAHQRAYEAARTELAGKLARLDLDGVASEQILADLQTVEAGQGHALTMTVKLPRKGSRPFHSYVQKARREHQALWMAKNAFVRANLRLVVTIARRFNHGRMPLQDLIQEGNIGLMKAVDRFDHRKGFRFSTYGSWWIRHAISRAIADKARAVRLPVHMIDAYNNVRKARRSFEVEHGRRPSDAEVAELSGVSVERIARMRWSLVENPMSLDQPLGEDRERTMLDTMVDPDLEPTPDIIESRELHETLKEVFAKLSSMEADILRKRMGLDDERRMTLKEIGESYSLSRERIRQLQEQALGKLRLEFRRRELLD